MSRELTLEDLAAIDARLEAATPGPWTWWADPDTGAHYEWLQNEGAGRFDLLRTDPDREPSAANADLIAHAPEDLRRLRAEVERLTRELAAAREPMLGDGEIAPNVYPGGLGYCDLTCPQHDGKRCRILGVRAPEAHVCPPWADRLRSTTAKLQNDVVELTQAGDLHRKEGDEARALIRDLAHLSPGALGSYSLWAQIHDFLEAIDPEGPRAPAGRGLTELDERERSVVLALQSVCDALDVSIVGSVRLNDGPGPRNLAAAADADGTLRVWLEGPYDVRRLTAAHVVPSSAVLAEVRAERDRQDAKFGEQNHPDTYGDEFLSYTPILGQPDLHRRVLNIYGPTWTEILLEEVSEAVEAIGDVAALRAELVQVAAVAVAWVEAIDRRQGGTP